MLDLKNRYKVPNLWKTFGSDNKYYAFLGLNPKNFFDYLVKNKRMTKEFFDNMNMQTKFFNCKHFYLDRFYGFMKRMDYNNDNFIDDILAYVFHCVKLIKVQKIIFFQ